MLMTPKRKSVLHSSRHTAGQNQEPRMHTELQGVVKASLRRVRKAATSVNQQESDSHAGTNMGLWIRALQLRIRSRSSEDSRQGDSSLNETPDSDTRDSVTLAADSRIRTLPLDSRAKRFRHRTRVSYDKTL